MNKNEGKHHACSSSPIAIIWLLTSMLHSLSSNVDGISYSQKDFYLGGASCPREVNWYSLCKWEKRWKTGKTKQTVQSWLQFTSLNSGWCWIRQNVLQFDIQNIPVILLAKGHLAFAQLAVFSFQIAQSPESSADNPALLRTR